MPRLALGLFLALLVQATIAAPLRFHFGPGPAPAEHIPVSPTDLYSPERGFGFEPGARVAAMPSHFTVRLPAEGNYRVTASLGDPVHPTSTAIKAELRRLAFEPIRCAPGEFKTVRFIANVRTPVIPAGENRRAGSVALKAPRETVQEAWAWDDALTLEFLGESPAVRSVIVEPADVPTLFLLGDSTVCDQSKEPYASWGQMLPRWFKPEIAVANHGESGETYRDSLGRRRLDKILSVLAPGDWVIMQFGHNDQKQIAAGTGGPFTTYRAEIAQHVAAIRAHGGNPVLVSPMERRNFDADGNVRPTLTDYAAASRQAAEELDVPFIDLHALSIRFYAALGPEKSARAFAAPDGKIDNTHHNNYGSYELAKCIVQSIRELKLPIAQLIVDDFAAFDPSQPDDPATLAIPPSVDFTNQRPLGD